MFTGCLVLVVVCCCLLVCCVVCCVVITGDWFACCLIVCVVAVKVLFCFGGFDVGWFDTFGFVGLLGLCCFVLIVLFLSLILFVCC